MPKFDLLNQLANFLDDLPHNRFYMPVWVSDDATEISCGSAGCAGGWAVTLFHHMGLKIEQLSQLFPISTITYEDKNGIVAFSSFFQIPTHKACLICSQSSYHTSQTVTPQMAAIRIREVITDLGGTVTEDYPITNPLELAVL